MRATNARVTADDSPFAQIFRQRDILEDTVDDGSSSKRRGGLLNSGNHFDERGGERVGDGLNDRDGRDYLSNSRVICECFLKLLD